MNQTLVPTPIVYFDEKDTAHVGGTNIPVRVVDANDAPVAIRLEAANISETFRSFDGCLWSETSGYTRRYNAAGLAQTYLRRSKSQSIGQIAELASHHRNVHELWPSTSRVSRHTNMKLRPAADLADNSPGVMASPMLAAAREVAENTISIGPRLYRRSLGPRLVPDTYGLKGKETGKLSAYQSYNHPTVNIYSFRIDELDFALEFCRQFFGKPFVFDAGQVQIVEPSLIPKMDTLTHSLECMNWSFLGGFKRRRLSEFSPRMIEKIIELRDAYQELHGNDESARFFDKSSGTIWPHFEWETEFPDAERIAAISFALADLDTLNAFGLRRRAAFARRRLAVSAGTFDPNTAEPDDDDDEFAGLEMSALL